MTRVDFAAKILDLAGKEIPGPEGMLTLRMVAINALTGTLRGDEELSQPKKLELYMLAMKSARPEPADLTAEEVVLLKERIGKAYGPLVVGRAFEILEGKV